MRKVACIMVLGSLLAVPAMASITSINGLAGSQASAYKVNQTPDTIPFTLTANGYNDDTLYVWNELQNVTLLADLSVDRVADPSASYITGTAGNYKIKAGTIVSSHYVQWDPAGTKTVKAELNFDSDIFAFITADSKLANSDFLGLPGVDYSDFANRGLESGDTTVWGSSDSSVEISWAASSPGDWTRLLTAYSPRADNNTIPAPSALLLGTLGLGLVHRLKRKRIY